MRGLVKEVLKVFLCIIVSIFVCLSVLFLLFPPLSVDPVPIAFIKINFSYTFFGTFLGAVFSSIFFSVFIKGKRKLSRFFSSLIGIFVGVISANIGIFLLIPWFFVLLGSKPASGVGAEGAIVFYAVFLLFFGAITSSFTYGLFFGQ